MLMTIKENIRKLLGNIPAGIDLVAAVKGRQIQDIKEAIDAGIKIIGENYIQEAESLYPAVGNRVQRHFIGHLQKNKVKKAVLLFDMIETVDSIDLAAEIDKRCHEIDKIMPVLIEINSGREPQKAGAFPENVTSLVHEISGLSHVRVMGLMTMGPFTANPESLRPCFAETKLIFDRLQKLDLPNVEMKYLSMGMSDSYRIAIEEGANIVRIGSKIFTG